MDLMRGLDSGQILAMRKNHIWGIILYDYSKLLICQNLSIKETDICL